MQKGFTFSLSDTILLNGTFYSSSMSHRGQQHRMQNPGIAGLNCMTLDLTAPLSSYSISIELPMYSTTQFQNILYHFFPLYPEFSSFCSFHHGHHYEYLERESNWDFKRLKRLFRTKRSTPRHRCWERKQTSKYASNVLQKNTW